ncbi:MAG: cellulase family glycosylhydrolase [Anaerolineaceae bacterium]|nr:cellulase family glycosylhydrolase [Anaerolineaceae bacterium]
MRLKRIIFVVLVLGLIACGEGDVAETAVPLPTSLPTAAPESLPTAAVFVGETAVAPTAVAPTATATPTQIPTLTPTPTHPNYSGPTLNRSDIGVQVYLHRVNVPALVAQLNELGVGWVKAQVSWKLFQPYPDQLSEERFADLDALVAQANASGIRVLLGVAKAPEWSRPITEQDGPPGDYALYRDFMQLLARRYAGQVAAYELWNEPNLQREWYGTPLDAADLVALIHAGAEGVRAGDPAALVISGAPAVTGINDGIVAIDDRVYFRGMLAAGVAEVVDGFGVHPYGWANPPEATFANPDLTVPSHNNHPSFFFQDTLVDYGRLLTEFGVAEKPMWVTEFGWGSFETFSQPPPPGAEFMNNVTEWQQAVYTQNAYALAHEMAQVGPLILWNLNFAPWLGAAFSESGYSLLRPDGSPRPAYFALAALPKE